MKKYFIIAAAAIVALAACTKNEVETSSPKEISYNAVTAKNNVTKTVINTTFYAPSDPAFGAWALYQPTDWITNHAGNVWVGTDASTSAQISYETDTWKNTSGTDYWPISGSLVFMGYSPYTNVSGKAAIAVAENKVKLTVTNFQSVTGSYVDDLMWSDAVEATANTTNYDSNGNNPTTYNGVPIVFHHALSQIIVNAKTAADYAAQGYTFTITSITMTIDDTATLTVTDDLTTDPTVIWTEPATDVTPTILTSGSTALTTSYVQQGNTILVIPQTLTAEEDVLHITYQLVHNGVTSTASKNINLTAGSDATLTAFEKNKKYNLNLLFTLDEIKYSPDVTDWETTVTSEYDVPEDAS